MSNLQPFEFSEEVIQGFREKKEIPAHFYNKDGQILIYKKENASDTEIERILRFVHQGIFYDVDDAARLGLDGAKRAVPEGLSDTKLLSQQHAEELAADTTELFDSLKRTSITSFQAKRSSEKLASVFNDFETQPDAMNGLVNIIELMKGQDATQDVELAVKRTVVAMALKTRGMQAQSSREQAQMHDMVSVLMMSSLLCDIGYARMTLPTGAELTQDEMNYIKNHPLMSYLMVAHEPAMDERVKFNILCHHRPMRDGSIGNNYPDLKWLLGRLTALEEKYRDEPGRQSVADDIRTQLGLFKRDIPYMEDANILALASEFASLTSRTKWRGAFEPGRAVRMIINNSFFTYTDRIVREFLDYVAVSLCDNEMILKEGDFIVAAARGHDGKTFFEVCQITAANRYQSRPGVDRFATIVPDLQKSPKMRFAGFNLDRLKPDPRYAHYELAKDDTRHIVYAIDPEHDPEMFDALLQLVEGRRKRKAT